MTRIAAWTGARKGRHAALIGADSKLVASSVGSRSASDVWRAPYRWPSGLQSTPVSTSPSRLGRLASGDARDPRAMMAPRAFPDLEATG